jgi:amidophosphoribosyltransferase
MDLATRKAMRALAGPHADDPSAYAHAGTATYNAMEDWIRRHLNLTSLKYQVLDDLVCAISLPKEKLCTYCWDGVE